MRCLLNLSVQVQAKVHVQTHTHTHTHTHSLPHNPSASTLTDFLLSTQANGSIHILGKAASLTGKQTSNFFVVVVIVVVGLYNVLNVEIVYIKIWTSCFF